MFFYDCGLFFVLLPGDWRQAWNPILWSNQVLNKSDEAALECKKNQPLLNCIIVAWKEPIKTADSQTGMKNSKKKKEEEEEAEMCCVHTLLESSLLFS